MTAKSTKSKTNRKKTVTTSKKSTSNKKTTKKNTYIQTDLDIRRLEELRAKDFIKFCKPTFSNLRKTN